MNYQLFALLSLLSVGSAQLVNSVNSVASWASVLNAQVSPFSSGQGIGGALGIQATYPSLSDAVVALDSALGSASSSDANADLASAIITLEGNVATLLVNLAGKAADFTAVGAGTIASNDVTQLYGPSIEIASKLISIGSGQCDLISSVAPGLASMDAAFSSAAAAYTFSATAFPSPPACSGGASSAPESSAPASSAPTSSAPASSAPASSAPETSAPASSAPVTSGGASTTYRCRIKTGSNSGVVTTIIS